MSGEQHNTYISWVFLAYALFQTFIVLLMGAIFAMVFLLGSGDPDFPAPIMALVFAFVLIINILMTVPSFVAWFAVRGKKRWARTASIIAGALAALNAPIGTAACVYALWFFLGDEWKKVYSQQPEMLTAPEPYSYTESGPNPGSFWREPESNFRQPPDWR